MSRMRAAERELAQPLGVTRAIEASARELDYQGAEQSCIRMRPQAMNHIASTTAVSAATYGARR